jgi:glucose dehydrogenase
MRAYDVRTDRYVGLPRFLVPASSADTWPPEVRTRRWAASNWTGSALDEARGILYVPTEEATPDFWGGDRRGANLFANTLLALDANTGKRLWHFQVVHHDLLDGDLPTPPVLLTVTHEGRRGRCRRPGHQAGQPVRVRSRDRDPTVADRRAARASDEPARRDDVADAAVSDEAGTADAAAVHGS